MAFRFNPLTGMLDISSAGGGGGGMVIGDPVVGGSQYDILYIDVLGNLAVDAQFTRNSNAKHNTEILSFTYAQASNQNNGPGTEYFIQADNIGSNPTITFDGVSDTDTIVAAWNALNPSDTITVIAGGTNIPVAETVTLLGGGSAGFGSGTLNTFVPIEGVGIVATDDSPSNITALSIHGNLSPLLGTTAFGTTVGLTSNNVGSLAIFGEQQVQVFNTDFNTFNAGVSVNQQQSILSYNNLSIGIDTNDGGFVFRNGTDTILIPDTFTTPSVGDVLQITGGGGGFYTLDFAPVSGSGIPNGTLPFQFWRWNDNAATQDWDQVFILTLSNSGPDKNVLIGENAGALTETSYAGYANTIIGTSAAQSLSSGTASEISRNVVIGTNTALVTVLMENSIVMGYQALLGGTDQIINSIILTPDTTGSATGSPITSSICIGQGTRIHGTDMVVIGTGATGSIGSGSLDSVVIGSKAAQNALAMSGDVIIGESAASGYTGGSRNVFIGQNTSAGGAIGQSIALGTNAQVNASNQMTIGGIAGTVPDGAIYDIRFNNGVTDLGGEKYSFKYPDVITSITNGAGNQVEFYAGRGTGNAAGSEFNFYVSLPTTSGTTQHSHYLGLRLLGTFASVGDVGGIQNGTILTVDDDVSTINAITDGNFNVKDTSGNQIVLAQPTSKAVTIGDVDLAGSQNYFKVDDSNNDSRMVLGDNGIYIIRGGVGGGAHIMFSANVSESRIEIRDTRFQEDKGNDVASSNDLTLGGDGNCFTITGTTTINAITTANWRAGSQITLIFASNPTVKHNTAGGAGTARMFLAGSVDLAAQTNTVLGLIYDGTQWQETFRKTP